MAYVQLVIPHADGKNITQIQQKRKHDEVSLTSSQFILHQSHLKLSKYFA